MSNIANLFLGGIVRNIYTYSDYMLLMEQVVREERTTGPKQSAEMNYYTNLNLHRMHRLNKTVVLRESLRNVVTDLKVPQTWYILTEAWCGDAAQNIPVIAKAAALNPGIDVRLLLRDENSDLMNIYLTNGGRSIPKLVAVDLEYNELFSWGPRPAGAQALLHGYKANPVKTYKEFSEDVQRWYISDKTQSVQKELELLLTPVHSEK